MPIVRSYMCEVCAYCVEVRLEPHQWDDPPPECPQCARRLQQEFKPFGINGSASAKAHAIAEDIAGSDYNVADMTDARREGDVPKVRYKDDNPAQPNRSSNTAGAWGAARADIERAIQVGRQNRLRYGSGLDILQKSLKDGSQPDLIELSKKRSMRIY